MSILAQQMINAVRNGKAERPSAAEALKITEAEKHQKAVDLILRNLPDRIQDAARQGRSTLIIVDPVDDKDFTKNPETGEITLCGFSKLLFEQLQILATETRSKFSANIGIGFHSNNGEYVSISLAWAWNT